MARKNPAPVTVTHVELINCAIQFKKGQIRDYEREAEQAEQLDAAKLAEGLRDSIKRLEAQLEHLYKLYKIETGTDWGF